MTSSAIFSSERSLLLMNFVVENPFGHGDTPLCVTYTKEKKTGVGEATSRTPLDVLYVDKLVTVRNESVNFWYFCRDTTLVVPILCSVAHTMYVVL